MQQLYAVVLCALVAVCVAAPADPAASLVRYEANQEANEGYHFEYELSDQQKRLEDGSLKYGKDAEGNDIQFVAVRGHYSYIGDDGKNYWVEYEADENGYRTRSGTGEYDSSRTLDLRSGK